MCGRKREASVYGHRLGVIKSLSCSYLLAFHMALASLSYPKNPNRICELVEMLRRHARTRKPLRNWAPAEILNFQLVSWFLCFLFPFLQLFFLCFQQSNSRFSLFFMQTHKKYQIQLWRFDWIHSESRGEKIPQNKKISPEIFTSFHTFQAARAIIVLRDETSELSSLSKLFFCRWLSEINAALLLMTLELAEDASEFLINGQNNFALPKLIGSTCSGTWRRVTYGEAWKFHAALLG